MEAKNINDENLISRGFEKQYDDRPDGFYLLHKIDDKFYFTVDFKTMTVSVQMNGWGHIKKLKHIDTIEKFDDLFFALTGRKVELKV